MIPDYYVFDSMTGEILRSGICAPGDVALQAQAGESVREAGANDALHFHDIRGDARADKQPVQFTQNKTQITADGIDELGISGLPDPCSVIWPDGGKTEVVGGALRYRVDYPGTYTFKLFTPISLETEVSVVAVARS